MAKKVLIIRLSSIGDIVLASPVFRCLKNQQPDTSIHFVTRLTMKAVTEANPYIDQFHYFSGDLNALIEELKAEDFDLIIDLHNNIRSNRIRAALKKPAHVIRKKNIAKFFLTAMSIRTGPISHITQRSLDTVKPIGINDDGGGLDYFIPEGAGINITDIPVSHHAGYMVYVAGASYQCKKLPLHKMKELCAAIDHPLILVGGKDDAAEMEEVAAIDPVKIYNACGKFSLHESADIVRNAKLVVSHDTGFQYIACAFNKPVIALWGCTSPKLGFEPYYGSRFQEQRSEDPYINFYLDLYCQPCSKGTDHCPLEHFNCMNKLDMRKLVAEIHRKLGK